MNAPLPNQFDYSLYENYYPQISDDYGNIIDPYVTDGQNEALTQYALYANKSVEFEYPDSAYPNYYDAYAYDPSSYGWHEPISYHTYQAST